MEIYYTNWKTEIDKMDIKYNLTIFCLEVYKRHTLNKKKTNIFKVNGWKKIYHENSNQKRAWAAMLQVLH